MPQEHAKGGKTITLRVGARHLLTTDEGRYVWYPALQTIEFIRRGHRNAQHDDHWSLMEKQNNLDDAIVKACLVEVARRRTK